MFVTGLATSTTQLTQPTEEVLSNHTRAAQAMSADDLRELLNYVINRLLKDYSPIRSNENLNTLNVASSSCSSAAKAANGEKGSSSSSSPGAGEESQDGRSSTTPVLSTSPAINLKVFYQVTASPSAELLLDTLHEQRRKIAANAASHAFAAPANLVYTVMPASGLHHFGTFLSICGVRHD